MVVWIVADALGFADDPRLLGGQRRVLCQVWIQARWAGDGALLWVGSKRGQNARDRGAGDGTLLWLRSKRWCCTRDREQELGKRRLWTEGDTMAAKARIDIARSG